MIASPPFERSVFINCPFDDDFAPLLQAIAFCVTDLDFYPRLAPENADNAANRLDRIIELIRGSKFGIHDLSRCKSTAAGEVVVEGAIDEDGPFKRRRCNHPVVGCGSSP